MESAGRKENTRGELGLDKGAGGAGASTVVVDLVVKASFQAEHPSVEEAVYGRASVQAKLQQLMNDSKFVISEIDSVDREGQFVLTLSFADELNADKLLQFLQSPAASAFFAVSRYPMLLTHSNAEAFTEIYARRGWGTDAHSSRGTSGSGSSSANTRAYVEFLQRFLRDHRDTIKSVVDAGCGDWQFSRTVDWSGVEYCGIDVVADVVQRNQAQYGRGNGGAGSVRFIQRDITEDLPSADLLLSKEVLQHLPNDDVQRFLRQVGKYRFCLITNDLDVRTQTSQNPTIRRGGYRVLDIRKPPFSVPAKLLFTYNVEEDGGWLKGVFLVESTVAVKDQSH